MHERLYVCGQLFFVSIFPYESVFGYVSVITCLELEIRPTIIKKSIYLTCDLAHMYDGVRWGIGAHLTMLSTHLRANPILAQISLIII